MSSILILNTALERACALVSRDGGLIAAHAAEALQSAQTILQLAGEALREAGLKRTDAVAVVAGPGSFTGTRIGVAAAQGLCAAWDAPAVPLSTLALTAAAAQRKYGAEAYLVGRKSRAGELYFGCYMRAADGPVLHGAEQAGRLAELRLEPTVARDFLAVGDGWGDGWLDVADAPAAGEARIDSGAIEGHFGVRLKSEPVAAAVEDRDLATLARTSLNRGEIVAADLLRPNYVNETPQYREQPASG